MLAHAGAFEAGAAVSIGYTARVRADAGASDLTNVVGVDSTEPDHDPSNNTDDDVVGVRTPPATTLVPSPLAQTGTTVGLVGGRGLCAGSGSGDGRLLTLSGPRFTPCGSPALHHPVPLVVGV